MHAPGHFFDAGTHTPALAAAAWVGYYVAKGDLTSARRWEGQAMALMGSIWLGLPLATKGQLEVRLIGGAMDTDSLVCLVELVTLQLQYSRERDKRAVMGIPITDDLGTREPPTPESQSQ